MLIKQVDDGKPNYKTAKIHKSGMGRFYEQVLSEMEIIE